MAENQTAKNRVAFEGDGGLVGMGPLLGFRVPEGPT